MGKLQKEQEARAEKSAMPQDLPPPEYSNDTPKYAPASSSTAPPPPDNDDDDAPPPGYTPGPSPYQKMPVGWNIYYKMWSMRTFHIGPHADQPVYSFELHSGLLTSRPFLILFDGPDSKTAPRLATAHREGFMKSHAIIHVPGGGGGGGGPDGGQSQITEKLTAHSRRFNFSFNVGHGKDTRREDFEWRYSHGKEVRVLDRWAQGWKLVRLGGNHGELAQTTTTSSSGSGRKERPHGETSDGLPIVAVFADNSKMSKTKVARFHFVGAGATNEFGEAWALYVSMSALRLWELMMNSRAAAAGAV